MDSSPKEHPASPFVRVAKLLIPLLLVCGCSAEQTTSPKRLPTKIVESVSVPTESQPQNVLAGGEDAEYQKLAELLNVRKKQHLIFCSATEEGIQAVDAFNSAYPESPNRSQSLYLAAIARWNMYRYAEAANAYRAYLAEFPDRSLANLAITRLAQSLIRSDQAESAIVALDEFEDGPGADQRELHRADALALTGRVDEATALLRSWLEDHYANGNKRVLEVVEQQLARIELIGQPLQDFQVPDAPGSDAILTPQAYRGQVLLVDFWASWCSPCMAQMPHLVDIYQHLHPKGFEILGVSLDTDANRMAAALKRVGAQWPQYFDGNRWENELAVEFDVHRIPYTLLVDRDGIVRAVDPPPAAVERMVTQLVANE